MINRKRGPATTSQPSKSQEQARQQRIEEERQRKLRIEHAEQEAQKEQQKRLEESRRKREEEERLKREQEEQERKRRQMEEESKRKLEEQKRQLEQTRQKKLEEETRLLEEQRKKLLEQKRRELQAHEAKLQREAAEQRRLLEQKRQEYAEHEARLEEQRKELQFSTLEVVQEQTAPEFDLLGGVSDVEDDNENEVSSQAPSEEFGSEYDDSTSRPKLHRAVQQRGPIDVKVDNALDGLSTQVPITKTTKKDGTYIFGSRVMKTGVEEGKVMVTVGSNKMELQLYISKYEKVESVRLKGLRAAIPVCTALGAKRR